MLDPDRALYYPITGDGPVPPLPIVTAEAILRQMGCGGHGYVRTPFISTFYYVAGKLGCRLSFRQHFHRGVWLHRMTRLP